MPDDDVLDPSDAAADNAVGEVKFPNTENENPDDDSKGTDTPTPDNSAGDEAPEAATVPPDDPWGPGDVDDSPRESQDIRFHK